MLRLTLDLADSSLFSPTFRSLRSPPGPVALQTSVQARLPLPFAASFFSHLAQGILIRSSTKKRERRARLEDEVSEWQAGDCGAVGYGEVTLTG